MSYIKNIKSLNLITTEKNHIIHRSNTDNLKLTWSSLEKILSNKHIIPGRVLNKTHRGYLLGFFGYIGFASWSSTSINLRLGEKTHFTIIKLDHVSKSILLKVKGD